MFFYSQEQQDYVIKYGNSSNSNNFTFHPERWTQKPNGEWEHQPSWVEAHDGPFVKEYQGQWVEEEPKDEWVEGYRDWARRNRDYRDPHDAIGPEEALELLEKLGKGEWPFGDVCMPKKGEQLEFDFVRQMQI